MPRKLKKTTEPKYMILNYKFEIIPNKEQEETLIGWLDICRQYYNSALLDRERHYKETGKGLGRMKQQEQMTADKQRFSILKEIPSQPLQEVLVRLEKAYQSFFDKRARYPKLKKYKDYNSMTFTQFGYFSTAKKNGEKSQSRRAVSITGEKEERKLLISSLGEVTIKPHRLLNTLDIQNDELNTINFDPHIKQVIIKRQSGKWYAVFSIEVAKPEEIVINIMLESVKKTGLDLGLLHFITFSNGKTVECPKYLRENEQRISKLQKHLSRKKQNSNEYKKTLKKIQQLHAKIANQRKDFLHKLAYQIVQEYDFISVENLKIKNMLKNHKLAKSISDAGWGTFRNILEYKSTKFGKVFIKIDPKYTSVECSHCGERVKKSLSTRTHVCPKCGTILDRDHNAAINIEKKGITEYMKKII